MSAIRRNTGLVAALMTPVFMGLAPVFGKLTLRAGFDAYTLAAVRTCAAALILWVIYLIFFRQYIYIFPAGLLGTLTVGAINGLGSLLFYNGLLLLDDASLAQLLNMTYVIFVMALTRIYGQHVSLTSTIRAALALIAVYLLASGIGGRSLDNIHWIGVGLMLGGAFMYALHVVLSQRVMFEMPAPTMSLYALTFMGATVLVARLVYGPIYGLAWTPAVAQSGWSWILGLTAVTALSRVTLFAGVQGMGSLQTTLLNMAEAGVTLLVGFLWLDEMMTGIQWMGVALLFLSVVLSRWDTEIRDHVYRPLPSPSLVGGIPDRTGPIEPNPFAVITNTYRRRPTTPLAERDTDLPA